MERRRLSDEKYRANLVGKIRSALVPIDEQTTLLKLWDMSKGPVSEKWGEMYSNLGPHDKTHLRSALQAIHGKHKAVTVQIMREVENPETLRTQYPSINLGEYKSIFLFEIFSLEE